jgi:hypothetical protein
MIKTDFVNKFWLKNIKQSCNKKDRQLTFQQKYDESNHLLDIFREVVSHVQNTVLLHNSTQLDPERKCPTTRGHTHFSIMCIQATDKLKHNTCLLHIVYYTYTICITHTKLNITFTTMKMLNNLTL